MAVVSTFEDRAMSGTSVVNRPGFRAMMQAAEARMFDCLVAEDVDRISRDQGDWHAARKRLDFIGIIIHTAGGKVGKLDGALRALMGEMFIENLALHTRRGMDGVIRDGRHAGGRAYSYRAMPGSPGKLEIVEHEADVVRQTMSAESRRGISRHPSTEAASNRHAVTPGTPRPSMAICSAAPASSSTRSISTVSSGIGSA